MQLVKNLFLSDDREFSRKFQELLLVYLVEEQLGIPKDRILEIYINLAEFGPGIFGIYDAARHYFGKNPADLSAGEAVWLASILPSPKRYYQYYRNGAISPGWFERMRWNFDTMLERGRMTEAEYAAATAAIPRFYYPDPADGPGE
jgi:membrane peptidoglycan carboxypeptidase